MKKSKRIAMGIFPVIVLCITLFFAACSKDENGSTTLNIKLTDNPIPFDEVNVNIQEINVNFADSGSWIPLNTHAGMYDLLTLQNGIDTLIATAPVPQGTVKEIRFVLGSGNNVVVNGITYPLTIPSDGESGLKIKVDKKLNANLDSLIIDFDAALSIKEEPSGYKLRPVLKIKQ